MSKRKSRSALFMSGGFGSPHVKSARQKRKEAWRKRMQVRCHLWTKNLGKNLRSIQQLRHEIYLLHQQIDESLVPGRVRDLEMQVKKKRSKIREVQARNKDLCQKVNDVSKTLERKPPRLFNQHAKHVKKVDAYLRTKLVPVKSKQKRPRKQQPELSVFAQKLKAALDAADREDV